MRTRRTPYDPSKPIYDRRTTDKLKDAQLAPQEVDDPLGLEPGDKIIVMRSIRKDPLAAMHSRGDIDEAQYLGGRRFQQYFEDAEQGPRAIDSSAPYVDCSRVDRTNSPKVSKALDELAKAHDYLGADGSAIMHDILIYGLTMVQIARKRGFKEQSWADHFGRRAREHLHEIAFVYGFAKEPKGRMRVK